MMDQFFVGKAFIQHIFAKDLYAPTCGSDGDRHSPWLPQVYVPLEESKGTNDLKKSHEL